MGFFDFLSKKKREKKKRKAALESAKQHIEKVKQKIKLLQEFDGTLEKRYIRLDTEYNRSVDQAARMYDNPTEREIKYEALIEKLISLKTQKQTFLACRKTLKHLVAAYEKRSAELPSDIDLTLAQEIAKYVGDKDLQELLNVIQDEMPDETIDYGLWYEPAIPIDELAEAFSKTLAPYINAEVESPLRKEIEGEVKQRYKEAYAQKTNKPPSLATIPPRSEQFISFSCSVSS